jgi:hypothetical protein
LVEGSRAGGFELFELRAEPACWRSYDGIGAQRLILKPDSYLRIGVGEWEDSYFIEVDRGTEGSRAIARQLRAYASYYRAGVEQAERGVFPKVLWLVPGSRRAEAIQGCIGGLTAAERELFAVALQADVLEVVGGAAGGPRQPLCSRVGSA